MLTVGSLFAGIGGFDLGFERAGMRTLWQVEQSEFCRAVLARHFPTAKRFDDVCAVGAAELEPVTVVCGGVPCQPVSFVGKGLGADDERWLWPDTLRIVGELRPRYAVLENPTAFIGRGLLDVLGGLAEIGYDAEWSVVSAADVGAPHLRERVWIVAYPDADGDGLPRFPELDGAAAEACAGTARRGHADGLRDEVADAEGVGRQRPRQARNGRPGSSDGGRGGASGWWEVEPPVGRVADGFPGRVDRLHALGNALVPQIAELIGRRIVEHEIGTRERRQGGVT